MKLRKNITGFADLADKQSKVELKEIKSAIFSIEITKAYKISEIKEPGQSSNYFTVTLTDLRTNDTMGILINGQYPCYCGVTGDSSWMNLKFIELPLAVRNCMDKKFKYLTPTELYLTVDRNDLKELSESELRQINYWKSKTLGEIIFNGYD